MSLVESWKKRFISFEITSISLIFALLVTFIFYPGFMTYDSIHAIEGARFGVHDSIWPPMVSYIWSAVDLISTNPSLMHFSQIFLLLLSLSSVIYQITRQIKYVVVSIFLFLLIPSILGTLAAIWKDVLMASLLVTSFSISLKMQSVKNINVSFFLFLSTIFFLFLALCSRHNGIAAAVPLFFLTSFIFISKFDLNPTHFKKIAIVLSSILILLFFLIKTLLDSYSLPNFTKINSKFDDFSGQMILDIAGASVCTNSNLFYKLDQHLKVDEIIKAYDPRHLNLSKEIVDKFSINTNIKSIWLEVIKEHPICFAYQKFNMMKFMVGANKGRQFLVTDPHIIKNDFGYKLEPSKTRDYFVNYIFKFSSFPLLKPWFIYAISFFAFFQICRARNLKPEYISLYTSGILYFFSFIPFGNAADARLLFYSTTTSFLILIICFYERAKS
jgi:hypothetical protein